MLLEGIFLPLTTPFDRDGRVSDRKLLMNVEHYSRTPATGMVVLSEVGEVEALSDEEAKRVFETAMGAVTDGKVMLASVGRESFSKTMPLADVAYEAGYDAIAVRGPRSIADSSGQKECLNYFRMVADQTRIPMVLVSEAGRELSTEMIAAVAEHPNILGVVCGGTAGEITAIRQASAEVSREVTVTTVFGAVTRRMQRAAASSGSHLGGVAVLEARPGLRTRTKRVGFQVLAGSSAGMLEAWRAGASGAVPPLGVCVPQACCEVWQAFRDGDGALAEEKQKRLRVISRRYEGGAHASVAALKYGCDFNGYYGGRPRLPVLPLLEAECAEIERELAGMRS